MEIWKDIKGFEGFYQVSNFGNVKRLKTKVKSKNNSYRTVKERFLKLNTDDKGYFIVVLSVKNKCKTKKVHQLVAQEFLSHTPCGMKTVVDHIDNNKNNNKASNLQLISQRKNTSKDKKGTSKYTGVSWFKRDEKWQSSIRINGKCRHLGYFISEIEASKAYENSILKNN